MNHLNRVGVIGMGAMGFPMAMNLLKAGFSVSVFNRTQTKCEAAVQAGACLVDSISNLANSNDAVVIMLSDDASVRQIIYGKDGLAKGAQPGLIVIDSTTIHPLTTQEISCALAKTKVEYLDAPVMSNRKDAEDGTLWFLVGGQKTAYQKAIPLFDSMGNRHNYLGPSGAGTGAKIGGKNKIWWQKRMYLGKIQWLKRKASTRLRHRL